jgi:hypothetical protein
MVESLAEVTHRCELQDARSRGDVPLHDNHTMNGLCSVLPSRGFGRFHGVQDGDANAMFLGTFPSPWKMH